MEDYMASHKEDLLKKKTMIQMLINSQIYRSKVDIPSFPPNIPDFPSGMTSYIPRGGFISWKLGVDKYVKIWSPTHRGAQVQTVSFRGVGDANVSGIGSPHGGMISRKMRMYILY